MATGEISPQEEPSPAFEAPELTAPASASAKPSFIMGKPRAKPRTKQRQLKRKPGCGTRRLKAQRRTSTLHETGKRSPILKRTVQDGVKQPIFN